MFDSQLPNSCHFARQLTAEPPVLKFFFFFFFKLLKNHIFAKTIFNFLFEIIGWTEEESDVVHLHLEGKSPMLPMICKEHDPQLLGEEG